MTRDHFPDSIPWRQHLTHIPVSHQLAKTDIVDFTKTFESYIKFAADIRASSSSASKSCLKISYYPSPSSHPCSCYHTADTAPTATPPATAAAAGGAPAVPSFGAATKPFGAFGAFGATGAKPAFLAGPPPAAAKSQDEEDGEDGDDAPPEPEAPREPTAEDKEALYTQKWVTEGREMDDMVVLDVGQFIVC